uniref:Uncharacterized protein n=1 Tax=Aegilops tauschii TaxID=37682 RepID=R7W959_AEGTA
MAATATSLGLALHRRDHDPSSHRRPVPSSSLISTSAFRSRSRRAKCSRRVVPPLSAAAGDLEGSFNMLWLQQLRALVLQHLRIIPVARLFVVVMLMVMIMAAMLVCGMQVARLFVVIMLMFINNSHFVFWQKFSMNLS